MELSGVRIVEPVPVAARVRNGVREVVRGMVYAPGEWRFRQDLAARAVPDRRDLHLNFGWLREPRRAAEARIGGGVKLGHLRERFGEAREGFNVLYLVSSLLHLIPHVEELVAFAKRRGIPVVWNQNGVAYPAWAGSGYPWFNLPMRRLIGQADFVVWQSEFCRACAERYLGSIDSPGDVLWNPVDLERFRPGDEGLGGIDGGPVRLLAMGTSHAFYRVRAAVDCLGELRRRGVDARLAVAGELRWPGAAGEVATYVAAAGLADAVRLLPRFTQEEAPALYRGADVLLHAKYKDPCPTVPIEALACGLPVVGSRSGGMPELVADGTGELVDVPDEWTRDVAPGAGAMADAVEQVLARRADYGVAARAWAVRAFDACRWVDRHEAIFRGLLDGR